VETADRQFNVVIANGTIGGGSNVAQFGHSYYAYTNYDPTPVTFTDGYGALFALAVCKDDKTATETYYNDMEETMNIQNQGISYGGTGYSSTVTFNVGNGNPPPLSEGWLQNQGFGGTIQSQLAWLKTEAGLIPNMMPPQWALDTNSGPNPLFLTNLSAPINASADRAPDRPTDDKTAHYASLTITSPDGVKHEGSFIFPATDANKDFILAASSTDRKNTFVEFTVTDSTGTAVPNIISNVVPSSDNLDVTATLKMPAHSITIASIYEDK
jgi:hypothetical protein